MTNDLHEKAKFFRERAVALRKRARLIGSAVAQESMLAAAATWDELAEAALREAEVSELMQRGSADPVDKDGSSKGKD